MAKKKEKQKVTLDDFVTDLKGALEVDKYRMAKVLTVGLFIVFLVTFTVSLTLLILEAVQVLDSVPTFWRWIFGGSGIGLCGQGIRKWLK